MKRNQIYLESGHIWHTNFEKTVAGIRQPDIYYTLRKFLIVVFQTISLAPINHQNGRFSLHLKISLRN